MFLAVLRVVVVCSAKPLLELRLPLPRFAVPLLLLIAKLIAACFMRSFAAAISSPLSPSLSAYILALPFVVAGVGFWPRRLGAGGFLAAAAAKSLRAVGSYWRPFMVKFLVVGPVAAAPVVTESVTFVLASLAFMNACSSFFVIGLRMNYEAASSSFSC